MRLQKVEKESNRDNKKRTSKKNRTSTPGRNKNVFPKITPDRNSIFEQSFFHGNGILGNHTNLNSGQPNNKYEREADQVVDTTARPPVSASRSKQNSILHSIGGNHSIQQKIASGKQKVSQPGYKYEQGAGRMAEEVMRMLDPAMVADTRSEATSERIHGLCPRCQRRLREGKPLSCKECENKLRRKESSMELDAVDLRTRTAEARDESAERAKRRRQFGNRATQAHGSRVQGLCSANLASSCHPSFAGMSVRSAQDTGWNINDSETTRDEMEWQHSTNTNQNSLTTQTPHPEDLLPANPRQRSKVLSMFSLFAVGVDGRWLSGNMGPGTDLDPRTRADVEDKFGREFSRVKIHNSTSAQLVAESLGARAVTIGRHIAFAPGEYRPEESDGRDLLMHELAHTVQQESVPGIPSGIIPLMPASDVSERQVYAAVQSMNAGHMDFGSSQLVSTFGPQANRVSVCEVLVAAAVGTAFATIVAAISAGCAAGSVVTVGGLAIPCTGLVIASAAVGTADTILWTAILQNAICGTPLTAETQAAAQ